MPIVPVMWTVWGVLVVVTAALFLYRSSLTKDEEDQIFLDDSFDHEKSAQAAIVAKVNKIQPILRAAMWVVGIATLFVIGYYICGRLSTSSSSTPVGNCLSCRAAMHWLPPGVVPDPVCPLLDFLAGAVSVARNDFVFQRLVFFVLHAQRMPFVVDKLNPKLAIGAVHLGVAGMVDELVF